MCAILLMLFTRRGQNYTGY